MIGGEFVFFPQLSRFCFENVLILLVKTFQQLIKSCVSLFQKNQRIHYSDVVLDPPVTYQYTLSRGAGIAGMLDGASKNHTIAGYTHLHPVASRQLFYKFCTLCGETADST